MVKESMEDISPSWEIYRAKTMRDSLLPIPLNNNIHIFLFPELLIILITLITHKLTRSFQHLISNNVFNPTSQLLRRSMCILFQRLCIGTLFLNGWLIIITDSLFTVTLAIAAEVSHMICDICYSMFVSSQASVINCLKFINR